MRKFHYPPRCHRARCASPGLRLALIAQTARSSPPLSCRPGGAPYAAITRVLYLQYRLFNFHGSEKNGESMSFTLHVFAGGFASCFALYAQIFLKFFSGFDNGLRDVLMGYALCRSDGLHGLPLYTELP